MPKYKAERNPSTEKPGTILSASITIRAFITMEKRPKVIIESGRVRRVSTGLIKMFIAPKTTARMKYVSHLSTETPGKRYAVTNMARAESKR